MRSNLHDIAQEVQAGRTVVTTVKPVLVKIEARAHPCGIQLRLHLLDEQGGTIRLEHVVPNLHVLCAALGIDEYEVCWHVSPQDKEPGGYVPFSSFRVRRVRTSRLTQGPRMANQQQRDSRDTAWQDRSSHEGYRCVSF